ncbi:MAG: sulfite exporter TauE/SafE family protein [Bdellovibrionales bacterium]|nr:sulfite exporter TauE/SafE family protein [Bdellovibrionales bacterium]
MDHSSMMATMFSDTSIFMIPWVAFIAGLGGSLHCVGMCGGLVVATAPNRSSIAAYQVGRIISYALLGGLAGLIGGLLTFKQNHPVFRFMPMLMIGLLLIFWGVQGWRGKKNSLPLPEGVTSYLNSLWGRVVGSSNLKAHSTSLRSFLIGLLSIFLPCGFLYGVIFALAALGNPWAGVFGMAAFALGTVPAMSIAPEIVRRVLHPLYRLTPRLTPILLTICGLFLLSKAVYKLVG